MISASLAASGAILARPALAQTLVHGAAADLTQIYAASGPFAVETSTDDWLDTARQRSLPVQLYRPTVRQDFQPTASSARPPNAVAAAVPLVIYSHGLGGSRAAGKLWCEHWATHGIASLSIQHPGSDREIFRDARGNLGRVREAFRTAFSLENLILRAQDVSFTITQAQRRIALSAASNSAQATPQDRLWAGISGTLIGVGGHSFGAQTALLAAGERRPELSLRLSDARPLAFLGLSASARGAQGPNDASLASRFGAIRRPFFCITGTEDTLTREDVNVENRSLPYLAMPSGGKALLVLTGADHMVLGGNPQESLRIFAHGTGDHRVIERQIKLSTLAFWKAHLHNDPEARRWQEQHWAAGLGKNGTVAQK